MHLSFLQLLERGPEEDYTSFIVGIDSLLMGAGTWEFMVRHGSWPYGDTPTWLVTHAEEPAPIEGAVAETYAGDVAEVVRRIGERGYERTWSSAAVTWRVSCWRPTYSTSRS